MTTLAQLTQRVIRRVSMVDGASVQTYAETRIEEMIQHKFDILFDELWWDDLMFRQSYTLDGTTGLITGDISSLCKKFKDIKEIYLENYPDPLKTWVGQGNLALYNGHPVYTSYTTDMTKLFKVWPVDTSGDVYVVGRTKPADFTSGDTVNFDEQVLVLGAAYDWLEDDGTNPGATEKMQQLFESRVAQLKNLESAKPIPLNPRISYLHDQWTEQ